MNARAEGTRGDVLALTFRGLELYAAIPPEVWADRLRLIHQAKREFQGRLEP